MAGTADSEMRCILEELLSSSESDDSDVVMEEYSRVTVAAFSSLNREIHVRQENYIKDVIAKYSDTDFKKHFRMNPDTFEKLLDFINLPESDYCGGNVPIQKHEMLYITLWYMANQACTLRQIGDKFNRSIKCVWAVVGRVCSHIERKSDQFIKWPSTLSLNTVTRKFADRSGFPGVLGAIDGCHIRIVAPSEQQATYLNRKMFHSIVLLAVCLPNREFSFIHVGFPGSVHDSRVLRNSGLYHQASQANSTLFTSADYHIIGDSAFPALTWLIPALKETELIDEKRKRFNKKLSKTRVVIENAFGDLLNRWRRLRFIHSKVPRAISIVVTACCLHNFCAWQSDNVIENEEEQNLQDIEEEYPPTNSSDVLHTNDGQAKRLSYIDMIG